MAVTGSLISWCLFSSYSSSRSTFQGGDDRDQDGVYPDPYGTAEEGAYEGPEDCGIVKPAFSTFLPWLLEGYY